MANGQCGFYLATLFLLKIFTDDHDGPTNHVSATGLATILPENIQL